MKDSNYIASIADIKSLKDLPEEFMPYAAFQARREERDLKGDEKVAILNVATTTSYIAVFLDSDKTIEEVEKEVGEAGACLNTDSRRILKELLRGG